MGNLFSAYKEGWACYQNISTRINHLAKKTVLFSVKSVFIGETHANDITTKHTRFRACSAEVGGQLFPLYG
jgi:hypothetical protein